jgi:hypothetical protein
LDIIGRGETLSGHGFQVSGFRPALAFSLLKPYMKLQLFGTVGRATVPAETGRHSDRPYDSTRPKFLFRFDWLLFKPAAALNPWIRRECLYSSGHNGLTSPKRIQSGRARAGLNRST